jgi:hypothetical protein
MCPGPALSIADPRTWRVFATPSRRAVAVGAAVQIVVMAAYYAAVPELDASVVPLGVAGGVVGAAAAPQSRGLWVEGAGASVLGCCLFLVGYVAWGGLQAIQLEPVYGRRLVGVYLGLAITQSLMLLPAYAVDGLLAGVAVGWFRRRGWPSVPTRGN